MVENQWQNFSKTKSSVINLRVVRNLPNTMWKLLVLISFLLSGCIIPADVFFRNFSNQTVRLQATLADRRRFEKLPNKVNFYDTSTKKRHFYGDWRTNAFVRWVDTTTFYIDIP